MAFFWHSASFLLLSIWGCHDIGGHLIKDTIAYVSVCALNGHLVPTSAECLGAGKKAGTAAKFNFARQLVLTDHNLYPATHTHTHLRLLCSLHLISPMTFKLYMCATLNRQSIACFWRRHVTD